MLNTAMNHYVITSLNDFHFLLILFLKCIMGKWQKYGTYLNIPWSILIFVTLIFWYIYTCIYRSLGNSPYWILTSTPSRLGLELTTLGRHSPNNKPLTTSSSLQDQNLASDDERYLARWSLTYWSFEIHIA